MDQNFCKKLFASPKIITLQLPVPESYLKCDLFFCRVLAHFHKWYKLRIVDELAQTAPKDLQTATDLTMPFLFRVVPLFNAVHHQKISGFISPNGNLHLYCGYCHRSNIEIPFHDD